MSLVVVLTALPAGPGCASRRCIGFLAALLIVIAAPGPWLQAEWEHATSAGRSLAALLDAIEEVVSRYNVATDGTAAWDSRYLQAIGTVH